MIPHGIGLVENASSGLVWVNRLGIGVVTPSDIEHDGRMSIVVEGEAVTNDDQINLQLLIGDPNLLATFAVKALGCLLTEENQQAILEMVTIMAQMQRDEGKLPALIEEFKDDLFSPEEIDTLPGSFYSPEEQE